MNMIDEKNPRQESVKADSSDDEVIINLTDEVVIKTEDDNGILELAEDMADDAPQIDDEGKASEVEEDEDIIALEETGKIKSQEDEAIIEMDDQVAEDQDEIVEDQLIASAIEESLGADEDEDQEVTEEFDLNASDEDDTLLMDNAQDETDGHLSAMIGDDTAQAQRDEDVFDLEEEIELEYERDEDEDELIDLDDERAEDNQDFVDLVLGQSKESDPSDDSEEPTEYLELEPEEPDDIIVLDADRDDDTEIIALAEDEAPEFVDSDDLPELEAVSELDFEDEEDAEDILTVDEHETDSSDDIIARAVEQSLGSDDDREQVDLAEEAEFELEDKDDLLDLDDSQEDGEEIVALAEEEPLKFESDGDLLDLDEGADLEADDEVIPLDGFNNLEAENEGDIIEITEFDQYFPADGEVLLKQSGMLDASGADEEDFLELIDIEEDSLSEDEKIIEFSDSPVKTENAEVNQLFSDGLEEDEPETIAPEPILSDDLENKLLENGVTEPIFSDSSEKETGLDDEDMEAAEETPDVSLELTAETETPSSEDEKFEFNFDPSTIAQQVDRLDTFLSEDSADEPEVASLPVDQAEEETGLEDSQIGRDMDEPLTVPPAQIDAAIERVINEKFSGKIEDII